MYIVYIYICTVNQLLLVTTLFHDLPKKNWFTAKKFRYLNVDFLKNLIAKTFEDWFAAINIREDNAFGKILARK